MKRSMVWVYGTSLVADKNGSFATRDRTFAELAQHTDSFNAISPQMYSVGCAAPDRPRPNYTATRYIETSGIQWCSGGGDYSPGDVFGAGVNGKAPRIPRNWTDVKAVKRCEQICSGAFECAGFTYYQADGKTEPLRCCAFRTITCADKPACSGPSCTARCYEKAIKPPSPCKPILIPCSSDPGITPDPALAARFHALGSHVQYWPTISSPDWLNADSCSPASCGKGPALCPCGQASDNLRPCSPNPSPCTTRHLDANETETMASLLADPGPLIASAIAEAKRWNVTGFNIDMEAPSPYGAQDTVVMKFVNTLSTALAEHGIQTSNCLSGINGSPGDAALINRTAMRTVPMNLYSDYDSEWTAEVNFWRQEGMVNKLGIGFCPTCYASPEPDLAAKFKVAAAYYEIDLFAYGAGYGPQFAPYWDLMRDFLKK